MGGGSGTGDHTISHIWHTLNTEGGWRQARYWHQHMLATIAPPPPLDLSRPNSFTYGEHTSSDNVDNN